MNNYKNLTRIHTHIENEKLTFFHSFKKISK